VVYFRKGELKTTTHKLGGEDMISEHLKIVLFALSPFMLIFIIVSYYVISKFDEDKPNSIYYAIPFLFVYVGGSLLLWIPALIVSGMGIFADLTKPKTEKENSE
jgi:hypothetical protein